MTTIDTPSADERSGIARITHGDPQRTREFRANLAVFARRSDDPEVRRMVQEVLDGRRDVRDVLRSRQFNEVGERHLANLEAGIERLTEEERAEVFDPGRRTPSTVLDGLRDGSVPPGDGWAPRDDAERPDPALRHLR